MSEYVDELYEGPEHPEQEYAKKEFGLLMYRLQNLPLRSRARLQSAFTQKMVDTTLAVDTPKGKLSFVILGKTSAGRAMSLLTPQPATIAWIDTFAPGGVFWDIGASGGVFSLYAALGTDTKVVAFEPAAVNYFLLAANCEANSRAPTTSRLMHRARPRRSLPAASERFGGPMCISCISRSGRARRAVNGSWTCWRRAVLS